MSYHFAPETEEERRQLFYWLKTASSYTAWERVGRYYKVWVDKFKLLYDESQRHPDLEHGVLMHTSDIVLVMSCYSFFEEALARLKKGNKRPFVWLGQTGHFSEALRPVDYWMEATRRGEGGDNEIKEMYSEHWPDVWAAREKLVEAWGDVGVVVQTRHIDMPAKVGHINDPSTGFGLDKLCKFPPGDLPEVPVPTKTVLVKTGDIVPCFGIWEPVKADLSPGFVGLFKKPLPPPDGHFELDGCMNYLHQGSAAPTIDFDGDDPRNEGRPTVWRLLWEDTRYRDGVIPEEERDYPFFDIAEPAGPAPRMPDFIQHEPDLQPVDEVIQARTGDTAVRSGAWAVLGDLQARAVVVAGDPLPEHRGRSVEWVWVSAAGAANTSAA